MGDSSGGDVQKYKYNGKELDRFLNWNMLDYGARWMDSKLQQWLTPDPLAEKAPGISPYVYCADNPVKYVDLRGDSISLDLQAINAIYNGLEKGTQITMTFHNGVLDPSSIAEAAKSSSDVFLQDLYEIATNPQMVELKVSDSNAFIMNNRRLEEYWKYSRRFQYRGGLLWTCSTTTPRIRISKREKYTR